METTIENRQIAVMAYDRLRMEGRTGAAISLASTILHGNEVRPENSAYRKEIETAIRMCGGKTTPGKESEALFRLDGQTGMTQERYDSIMEDLYRTHSSMKILTIDRIKEFMEPSYALSFVNYDDNLDLNLNLIQRCLDSGSADKLLEQTEDWYLDSRTAEARRVMDELRMKCLEDGYSAAHVEEFLGDNEDVIMQEILDRDNSDVMKELLGNTSPIPVRIEMLSNHDCINSDYHESQDGYSYEDSYFGDMIDVLNLNPAKVREMLAGQGTRVVGQFPDMTSRTGNELVPYGEFIDEINNSCSPANQLVFMTRVNPLDLYACNFNLTEITVPNDNLCGLFSPFYGGGSILQMTLKRDVTLKLGTRDENGFRLVIDGPDCGSPYHIKEVYGATNIIFRKTAKLAKEINSQN